MSFRPHLQVGILLITAWFLQCDSVSSHGVIAFQDRRFGDYDIFTVRTDGSHKFRVTKEHQPNLYPALSPDGKQIAFVSYVDGLFQIFRIETTGKNIKRLSDGTANDTEPSWSPDGAHIAFVSHRPTESDPAQHIFVMDADGGNLRQITFGRPDSLVVWSPDGKQLLILKQLTLYRVNLDEGELTPFPDPSRYSGVFSRMSYGAWSPDMSSIAFLANGALYITSDNGLTVQKIDTRDLFLADSKITWSPGGESVGFTAEGGIYSVSTDGTRLRRIVSGTTASWPSWSR